MNARGRMGHLSVVYAIAISAASAEPVAPSQVAPGAALSGVLCSRLEFIISADGSRSIVHDAVMNDGAFASVDPFARAPAYQRIGEPTEAPWWSDDGRVVFERGAGHVVGDLKTGERRTVAVDGLTSRIRHGDDLVPRLVGREYFIVADAAARNVRAVNIDTGESRIAVQGSAGKDYPLRLYIGADGREIAREEQTEGRAGSRFVLTSHRRRPSLHLDAWEKLDPLFTSESYALSSKKRFVAVHTRPSGSKAIVSVDTRTLALREVMPLSDRLAPVVGLSANGEAIEWRVDFTPVPSLTFTKSAPAALVKLAKRFPDATFEFQSQSRDGRTRIVKVRALSGQTAFVRIQSGKTDFVTVPCRQPRMVATAKELEVAGSGTGWVVRWRSVEDRRRADAPIIFVLPERPTGSVRPFLDPVFESMAVRGADVYLLVYPGSWPADASGRRAGGDPFAFARAVIGEVVRSEKSRPVLLAGYGFGASIAMRVAPTYLADRSHGIFAIGAQAEPESGGAKSPAGGASIVFFHGSMDPNTRPSEIEELVRRLDGGMSTNGCVVIDGMDMPVAPFHWKEQSKAVQKLIALVMSKKRPSARAANASCEFVKI
jgi:hypothetical protein